MNGYTFECKFCSILNANQQMVIRDQSVGSMDSNPGTLNSDMHTMVGQLNQMAKPIRAFPFP